MASSKLNLHVFFFRKYGHLGLFEAKHTCVIHGLARYSFFCFRSERVDRCVGFEHDPLGLALTSLCDRPLLFVYFQVNNGVLYFLDYVEDVYIMGLFVLVSM